MWPELRHVGGAVFTSVYPAILIGQDRAKDGGRSREQAVGWEYTDPLSWRINTEESEDSKFKPGFPVVI